MVKCLVNGESNPASSGWRADHGCDEQGAGQREDVDDGAEKADAVKGVSGPMQSGPKNRRMRRGSTREGSCVSDGHSRLQSWLTWGHSARASV